MRFQLLTLFLALFFAALALASAPRKSVVVSYPHDTPPHVIEEAKADIKKLGGVITHEYNLFKGFAADVVETALEMVQTKGDHYSVFIEEDQVVSANSKRAFLAAQEA